MIARIDMRRQVYSVSIKKDLIEAADGAVHYFKYKSRSAFVEAALEYFLEELHQTLLKEQKKHENK